MEQELTFVGIDVAKAWVDVAVRPSGDIWSIAYDETGVAGLVDRLQALGPTAVVLEAIGAIRLTRYHLLRQSVQPGPEGDLDLQHAALEAYCATKGWRAQVIRDLGSGMNYRKKGLQELLEMILRRRMERLVITHKDRLLRFGAELVFTLCELQGIEIVIIHQGDQPSFEEELAQDVLEIITLFSARLYGSRSHQSKNLLDALANDGEQSVVETARQLSLIG